MDKKLIEDYRLLKVCYGADRGLVSLVTGDLLAATEERNLLQVPSDIAVVCVEDHEMDALFGEEHCWNEVIGYLQENYVWETKSLP